MNLRIGIFFVFALLGCSSNPKPVNSNNSSDKNLPFFISNNMGSSESISAADEANHRNRAAAISGKVILMQGPLPIGQSNIVLGLFKAAANTTKPLAEISTTSGGEFIITRPTLPGKYEIRVLDKRYTGKAELLLEDKPIRDVILELKPVH